MDIRYKDFHIRSANSAGCRQLAAWWNDGKVMAHAGFPSGINTSAAEIIEQMNAYRL